MEKQGGEIPIAHVTWGLFYDVCFMHYNTLQWTFNQIVRFWIVVMDDRHDV